MSEVEKSAAAAEEGGAGGSPAAEAVVPASPAAPPTVVPASAAAPAAQADRAGLDFVLDVPLRLTVEIGSAQMLVAEVLQLDEGSVVELDRMAGEPADVLVNGRIVGRGEITLVEDRLAVRILELDGRGPASGRGL